MKRSVKGDETWRALGRQLAERRRDAGHNQHSLAPLTGYGRSTVANVETGRQRVPRHFWQRCDEALGAEGALVACFDEIVSDRAEGGGAGPQVAPLGVITPSGAVGGSGSVDPALVPHWAGLLRVMAASHDAFGPRHLHDVARGELAIIHRFREMASGETRRGLLHVEARWAEFASWTADNLGDGQDAGYWLRMALSLARQTEDRHLVSYVMMRQAQRAIERRDASQAIRLASEASRSTATPGRDRALSSIRHAQGSALAGDRSMCKTALRDAYRFVEAADDADDLEDPGTIGRHCVRSYVVAHEGYCHLMLGQPRHAVVVLEGILPLWPPTYRQDEGLARSWLASAYASVGRLQEAATEGDRALTLAIEAGSVRMTRSLRHLDAALSPYSDVPESRQFRTRYATVRQVTGRMGR